MTDEASDASADQDDEDEDAGGHDDEVIGEGEEDEQDEDENAEDDGSGYDVSPDEDPDDYRCDAWDVPEISQRHDAVDTRISHWDTALQDAGLGIPVPAPAPPDDNDDDHDDDANKNKNNNNNNNNSKAARLGKLMADIESGALAMLRPPLLCHRGPSPHAAFHTVRRFHCDMSRTGHRQREMWAPVHMVPEIVGVGATGGMDAGSRRYFDLMACYCAELITDLLSSNFEVTHDLVTDCIGPFMGRLFEMASRGCCKGSPDFTAFYESVFMLKRLMWVPKCRRFFVQYADQLQLIVDRAPTSAHKEMLTCCMNLAPLDGATQSTALDPLLFWVYGWDMLLTHASRDVVEYLKQCNITSRIISSLLKFCERFALHEVSFDVLDWIILKVLSKLNALCCVDQVHAQQVVLQFVEDNIERNNLLLKSVSALLIIPVIFTGGTVSENLVMKALLLACSEGSPPILEVLFSLKKAFHMLSSTKSIELLFEKALERHSKGRGGLLFQMLKFCALRIKGLPNFATAAVAFVITQKIPFLQGDTEASRKRPLEERIKCHLSVLVSDFYRLKSIPDKRTWWEISACSLALDSDCINACFMLVASAHLICTSGFGAYSCVSSRFPSIMKECCYLSPEMIEENEECIASLLKNVPDRMELMQEILQKCKIAKREKWAALLRAMLISETQPLVIAEPRKLPHTLSSQCDSGCKEKIQKLLECPTITDCFGTVVNYLMSVDETKNEEAMRLLSKWPVSTNNVSFELFHQQLAVLEWLLMRKNLALFPGFLQLCEPEHIPSRLLSMAIESGLRDIAELLWCHGVSIPESTVNDGNTLAIEGEPRRTPPSHTNNSRAPNPNPLGLMPLSAMCSAAASPAPPPSQPATPQAPATSVPATAASPSRPSTGGITIVVTRTPQHGGATTSTTTTTTTTTSSTSSNSSSSSSLATAPACAPEGKSRGGSKGGDKAHGGSNNNNKQKEQRGDGGASRKAKKQQYIPLSVYEAARPLPQSNPPPVREYLSTPSADRPLAKHSASRNAVDALCEKIIDDQARSGACVNYETVKNEAMLRYNGSIKDVLASQVLEDFRRKEERMNSLVKLVVTTNPIITVSDLANLFAASEKLFSYADAKMGPITEHPLVRKQFPHCNEADAREVVDRVTSESLVSIFSEMLRRYMRPDPSTLIAEYSARSNISVEVLAKVAVVRSLGLFYTLYSHNRKSMDESHHRAFSTVFDTLRQEQEVQIKRYEEEAKSAFENFRKQQALAIQEMVSKASEVLPETPSKSYLCYVNKEVLCTIKWLQHWRVPVNWLGRNLRGLLSSRVLVDGVSLKAVFCWVAALLLKRGNFTNIFDPKVRIFCSDWETATHLPLEDLRNALEFFGLHLANNDTLAQIALEYITMYRRPEDDFALFMEQKGTPKQLRRKTLTTLCKVFAATTPPKSLEDLALLQEKCEKALKKPFSVLTGGLEFVKFVADNAQDLGLGSLTTLGGRFGADLRNSLKPSAQNLEELIQQAIDATPGTSGDPEFLSLVEEAVLKQVSAEDFREISPEGQSFVKYLSQSTLLRKSLEKRSASTSRVRTSQMIGHVVQCTEACNGNTELASTALCSFYGVNHITDLGKGTIQALLSESSPGSHSITNKIRSAATLVCGAEQCISSPLGVEKLNPTEVITFLKTTPLLTDISVWCHWDAQFKGKFGDLGEFLESHYIQWGCEHPILEYSPGQYLAIDGYPSEEKFKDAAITGPASSLAIQFVSLLWRDGAQLPVALLSSLYKQALCLRLQEETPRSLARFILDTINALPTILQQNYPATYTLFIGEFFKLNPKYKDSIVQASESRNDFCVLSQIGARHMVQPLLDLFVKHIKMCVPSPDSFVPMLAGHDATSTKIPIAQLGTPSPTPKTEPSTTTSASTPSLPLQVEVPIPGPCPGHETATQATLHTSQDHLQACQEKVDKIRAEYSPSNHSNAMCTSLENCLKNLSTELYSQASHFVLEIVQNAEDNKYTTSALPYLDFNIFKDRIVIQNNEIGFTEKDLVALCGVKSSKANQPGYIGHKGIGFKSVFRVTDYPEIHSGGYHFRFNASSLLGMITPEWVEELPEKPYPDPSITEIQLPLKLQPDLAGILCAKFEEITATLLMFLKKLSKITVKDHVSGKTHIMQRRIVKELACNTEHHCALVELCNHEFSQECSTDAIVEQWVVARRIFKSEVGVTCSQNNMAGDAEVCVAMPLKQTESPEEQQVFAFLPLKHYGMRFICQADWVVPSSREDIVADNKWNLWLRTKVCDVFMACACAFTCHQLSIGIQPSSTASQLASLLPTIPPVLDFFRPVVTSIAKEMQQKSWLCSSSNDPVCPGRVLMPPIGDPAPISEMLLLQTLGKYFMHPDIKLPETLALSMGIDFFSPHHMISVINCLSNKSLNEEREHSHEMPDISSISDGELLSWIEWLAVQFRTSSRYNQEVVTEELKHSPVLRIVSLTQDGRKETGAVNASPKSLHETVFFPSNSVHTGWKKLPFVRNIHFIAKGLLTPLSIPLLRHLGLSDFDEHSVISYHVIPFITEIFKQYKFHQDISPNTEVLSSQLVFLQQHWGSCMECRSGGKLINKVKPFIVLLTNKGYVHAGDSVYFGREYQVNDQSTFPTEILTIADLTLLHPIYLQQARTFAQQFYPEFFRQIGVDSQVKFKSSQVLSTCQELAQPDCPWNTFTRDLRENHQSVSIADWTSPDLDAILSKAEEGLIKFTLMQQFTCWLFTQSNEFIRDRCAAKVVDTSGLLISEIPSSVLLSLRRRNWLPTSFGRLAAPDRIMMHSAFLESVFGNLVEYINFGVHSIQPNEVLATKLQIVHSRDFDPTILLEHWSRWSDSASVDDLRKISLQQMIRVYEIAYSSLAQSPLKELIPKTVFIADQHKFVPASEACLSDNLGMVQYSSLPVYILKACGYPDILNPFFTDILGVPAFPTPQQYLSAIAAMCTQNRTKFESLASLVGKLLSWWHEQKIGIESLGSSEIWPTKDLKWVSTENLYIGDDQDLVDNFLHSSAHFLFWTLEQITSFSPLLRSLGIRCLSEVAERTVEKGVICIPGSRHEEQVLSLLPLVQKVLCYQFPELYQSLKTHFAETLSQVQFSTTHVLDVKFHIQSTTVTVTRSARCALDKSKFLFVTEQAELQDVLVELLRTFGLNSATSDDLAGRLCTVAESPHNLRRLFKHITEQPEVPDKPWAFVLSKALQPEEEDEVKKPKRPPVPSFPPNAPSCKDLINTDPTKLRTPKTSSSTQTVSLIEPSILQESPAPVKSSSTDPEPNMEHTSQHTSCTHEGEQPAAKSAERTQPEQQREVPKTSKPSRNRKPTASAAASEEGPGGDGDDDRNNDTESNTTTTTSSVERASSESNGPRRAEHFRGMEPGKEPALPRKALVSVSNADETPAVPVDVRAALRHMRTLNSADLSIKSIGNWGEELVFRLLQQTYGVTRVKWLNEAGEESGQCYDLKVEGTPPIFVEVKSTVEQTSHFFPLSRREWEFALSQGECFHIYYVFCVGRPEVHVTIRRNPSLSPTLYLFEENPADKS
ncbi:protein NO VEIN [Pelomyxa schiedti]|nr:protein NO VEIN [Pelomyxa schiedti]